MPTIDNLGLEPSQEFARSQQDRREGFEFISDATEVRALVTISKTSPYPSQANDFTISLLQIKRRQIFFPVFPLQNSTKFFGPTLNPKMGFSLEFHEKINALKDSKINAEHQKKLESMCEELYKIAKLCELINGRLNQFHKG